MGLFDLFAKKKSEAANAMPTAIDYVDWLLEHMLRTSKTELTLTTGKALPGSNPVAGEASPPCIPDTQIVVNRLKLLAGVPPVSLAKTSEGAFEQPRNNLTLCVNAWFHDTADRSVCTLRVQLRRHGEL
jgi:hypothetical protein